MKSPKFEAARNALSAAAEGKHSPAENYITGAEALSALLAAYERAIEGKRNAECRCEALEQENAILRRDLQDAYTAIDKSDEDLFKRFTGGNE